MTAVKRESSGLGVCSICNLRHTFFLKSKVSRRAAFKYGYEFAYSSQPSWKVYADFLSFAKRIREGLCDLELRDVIDLQSFI